MLYTYHIDTAVSRVEGQQVVSDEISLLVEPLSLEYKPVLLNLFHLYIFLQILQL